MEIKEQFQEFAFALQTMPRDELAAYASIIIGLLLVIIAVLSW